MPKRRSRIRNGFIVVKVPKQRDYATEYARRIARWIEKGFSKSQARGHPKPNETAVSSARRIKPPDDGQLQRALRVLQQEKNLAAAAKAVRLAPERLRQFAASKGAIIKRKRKWIVNPSLPRRMPMYSHGRQIVITVGDLSSASQMGRYMSAVGSFLKSNDRKWLQPFVGQSITDISGKTHLFETNANSLYRISSGGDEPFTQIYRVVV